MHFRQSIRTALKARVQGIPGLSTFSVLDTFSTPFDQSTLPRAAVSFSDEDIEDRYMMGDGEGTSRLLRASIGFAATDLIVLETMVERLEMLMNAKLLVGVTHKMTRTRFQDPDRAERDFFSVVVDYEIHYSLNSADLTSPA